MDVARSLLLTFNRTAPVVQQLSLPAVDPGPLCATLPERSRQLFCNRSLRLDHIDWVGFDMDYTLAIYDQPQMDRLTIEAALPKLIARGYPESLRELEYDLAFPVRGLVVDAELGNVLKMDRHKYVKRAYHGMRELTYAERRERYHGMRIRAKSSTRYYFIDSLYALSEVTLFAAGVTHLEGLGLRVDYHRWFYDIRDAVDVSHQDGSILSAITADPGRYVVRDPELPATLKQLRRAGKKLFLLTNSRPAYTQEMMRFLLADGLADGERWEQLFDLIVTSASKPRFFVAQDTPFSDPGGAPCERLEPGTPYLGGCATELARLAGVEGDRVLYVGDHIFGDVLRAKKHSPWRTVMIIQELEHELAAVATTQDAIDHLDQLEETRHALLEQLRALQGLLAHDAAEEPPESAELGARSADAKAERRALERRMERTRTRLRAVELECAQLEREIDHAFHPYWGSLLKAGGEPSSFGHQVEEYACLYTARVSNFLGYSPLHYFRSPRDRLPHEL